MSKIRSFPKKCSFKDLFDWTNISESVLIKFTTNTTTTFFLNVPFHNIKHVFIIFSRVWFSGLSWLIKGLCRQQTLCDRRLFWLREQYMQLYHEDGYCCGPLAADAIRVRLLFHQNNFHITFLLIKLELLQ